MNQRAKVNEPGKRGLPIASVTGAAVVENWLHQGLESCQPGVEK